MDRWNLRYVIAVSCAVAGVFIAGYSCAEEERCFQARQAVASKTRLIGEYTTALQNAYNQKDFTIARVLNFKINELRIQLKELERILTDCPKPDPEDVAEDPEPAKGDEKTYATKSCADLRKILFSLVRRIHTLTKRQKSLLSNLSVEEEVELNEATEDIEKVKRVLKTKCSVRKARRRVLRQLRR